MYKNINLWLRERGPGVQSRAYSKSTALKLASSHRVKCPCPVTAAPGRTLPYTPPFLALGRAPAPFLVLGLATRPRPCCCCRSSTPVCRSAATTCHLALRYCYSTASWNVCHDLENYFRVSTIERDGNMTIKYSVV